MSEPTIWISFAIDETIVRLGTESRWQAAFRNGDLKAETPVIVEQAGTIIYEGPAAGADVLSAHFGGGAASATDEVAQDAHRERDSEQATDSTQPPDMDHEPSGQGGPNDLPSETDKPNISGSRDEPSSNPTTNAAEKPGVGGQDSGNSTSDALSGFKATFSQMPAPLRWGVIAIAALVILSLLGRCMGSVGGDDAASGSASQTVYAARTLNLRSDPSRSAPIAGQIERGDSLSGTWVNSEGERWLLIEEGTHRGAYVWSGNILNVAPPAISGPEARRQLVHSASVRAAPLSTAEPLRNLPSGAWVDVRGVTTSGWAEVSIDGMGIGYVPQAAFEQGPSPAIVGPETIADDSSPELEAAPIRVCRSSQETRRDGVYEQIVCREGRGPWRPEGSPRLIRRTPDRQVATPPRPTQTPQTQPPEPTNVPVERPPVAPALITRPVFVEQPDARVLERLMPGRAQEDGRAGSVQLECEVQSSGRLTNCSTRSETPAGLGYGSAARSAMRYFRMAQTDQDGAPTVGRRVRLTVRFGFQEE